MPAVPPVPDADPIPDEVPAAEVTFSLGDLLLARRPRLVVTPALIAIDVALFAAMAATSGHVVFPSTTLTRWGALVPAAVADGEWWRLLSPMWLHAHPLHLVLNLVFLWQLGSIVERMLGPFVFLVVYLIAGVLATAVSLQTLASHGVSVGASGAIFGLVGVLLAIAVTSRRIPAVGRLVADLRTRLVGVTLANLVAGFIIPGIDNGAHVGGLVAGIILGWLVGRDAVIATPAPRRTLLPIALTVVLAAASIIAATPPGTGQGIAAERQRFEAVNTPAESAFRAAVADVRAGRRGAADAADAIARQMLPPLREARARSDALLREARARLLETGATGGPTPAVDPRRLAREQAYHDAYEWDGFLARYDEAWRVRLLGLRSGDAARIADGDARAARAVRFFSQRWTRPADAAAPPSRDPQR